MNSNWKKYKISEFLLRKKEIIFLDDKKIYKRLTIKMHNGGICVRDEVTGDLVRTKSQFIVKAGWLLLSKIDARNGAFGIIPEECDGGIITGNFWAYELNVSKIDPYFFFYFSRSEKFLEFCVASSQGATNRRYLQEEMFLNKEILLPPLLEQKRIVARIKNIERVYFKLHKNIKYSDTECRAILKNYLKFFFSRTNSRFRNWGSVIDFFSILGGTGFPKNYQGKNVGDFPFYKVSDMNNVSNSYNLGKANNYISKTDATELGARIIPPESLVFPKVGGAIATNKRRVTTIPCVIDNNLMALSPKNNLTSTFIYLFFLSIDLTELQRGSSVPAINQSKVGNIDFPDLDEKEERAAVNIISQVKERYEKIAMEKKNIVSLANALMPSVLAKAFNGEL